MNNEDVCDKYINKFIYKGRDFINYACFMYGFYNAEMSGEIGSGFVDDFQYFVFTKSIKSLISIRQLFNIGKVEDVFIILRTSFEGHIASRYIDEEYDAKILNDFIFIPQLIAARKIIYQDGKAIARGTQEIIEYIQRNPSEMKLGKDKKYFVDFYAFLCNYAHCNFSIIYDYINNNNLYTYDKINNRYMAKIMVLFVYAKLFESIVTVEGEEFPTDKEKNECYKLVKESIEFVYQRLNEFSKYDCKTANNELNKHMKRMFKNMKNSLKEEIGSLKKDFLQDK